MGPGHEAPEIDTGRMGGWSVGTYRLQCVNAEVILTHWRCGRAAYPAVNLFARAELHVLNF